MPKDKADDESAAKLTLPRALLACTRILELSPDEAAVTRDRGGLQARLGLVEGAVADLSRYLDKLDIDPGELAEAAERR